MEEFCLTLKDAPEVRNSLISSPLLVFPVPLNMHSAKA